MEDANFYLPKVDSYNIEVIAAKYGCRRYRNSQAYSDHNCIFAIIDQYHYP